MVMLYSKCGGRLRRGPCGSHAHGGHAHIRHAHEPDHIVFVLKWQTTLAYIEDVIVHGWLRFEQFQVSYAAGRDADSTHVEFDQLGVVGRCVTIDLALWDWGDIALHGVELVCL